MCSQIAPACSGQALADRSRDPGGVAAPQLRPGDLLEQCRRELALVGGLLLRVEAVADDDAVGGQHERVGCAAETAQRGRAGSADDADVHVRDLAGRRGHAVVAVDVAVQEAGRDARVVPSRTRERTDRE